MRRKYVVDKNYMEQVDLKAQELAKRLSAFRKALTTSNKNISEEQSIYNADEI